MLLSRAKRVKTSINPKTSGHLSFAPLANARSGPSNRVAPLANARSDQSNSERSDHWVFLKLVTGDSPQAGSAGRRKARHRPHPPAKAQSPFGLPWGPAFVLLPLCRMFAPSALRAQGLLLCRGESDYGAHGSPTGHSAFLAGGCGRSLAYRLPSEPACGRSPFANVNCSRL